MSKLLAGEKVVRNREASRNDVMSLPSDRSQRAPTKPKHQKFTGEDALALGATPDYFVWDGHSGQKPI
jgi:hypothetical protein